MKCILICHTTVHCILQIIHVWYSPTTPRWSIIPNKTRLKISFCAVHTEEQYAQIRKTPDFQYLLVCLSDRNILEKNSNLVSCILVGNGIVIMSSWCNKLGPLLKPKKCDITWHFWFCSIYKPHYGGVSYIHDTWLIIMHFILYFHDSFKFTNSNKKYLSIQLLFPCCLESCEEVRGEPQKCQHCSDGNGCSCPWWGLFLLPLAIITVMNAPMDALYPQVTMLAVLFVSGDDD